MITEASEPTELADVSVLIQAYRRDGVHHEVALSWLEAAMRQPGRAAISELTLSSVLRILTHPGAAKLPPDKSAVLSFCRAAADASAIQLIRPGEEHWRIFLALAERSGVHGNVIPDAYLAALAIENGFRFASFDRGFARFPGLDWRLLG